MARDALTVMGPFVESVQTTASKDGKEDQATATVSRLRADALRTAFDEACHRVGLDPVNVLGA